MKEKYADQDEEEREVRMALLASAGQTKTRQEKRQLRKEQGKRGSRPPRMATGAQGSVAESIAEEGDSDDEDNDQQGATAATAGEAGVADATAGQANDAASGEGTGSAAADAEAGDDAVEEALSAEDEDEVKQILAEENVAIVDEDLQLTFLDALTGCPLPQDILLHAVPVCGPYSAMLHYKYKAKLVPGTGKKGKAIRSALDLFSHAPDAARTEKDLMRAVKEEEVLRSLPGKVKLMAAGAAGQRKGPARTRSTEEA